jgi:predicted HAD superfamily Cof-like phosphohydrolase
MAKKPKQFYNHMIDEDMFNNFLEDISKFQEKFDEEYMGPPRFLPLDLHTFKVQHIKEEIDEYIQARHDSSLVDQLDALVDILYVVIGTAYQHGFDLAEAWRRVHEGNMLKVKAQKLTDSTRGSLFDIVKPPGWVKPNLEDLV